MRREERVPVEATTRLRPNEWSSVEVRLLDVSANGFRAECEARVLTGAAIALDVPGRGETLAYVSWRRGNRFGARFAEPIDVAAAGWTPVRGVQLLSRLLIERAEARAGGRMGHELEMRRRILESLPMRRGGEAG